MKTFHELFQKAIGPGESSVTRPWCELLMEKSIRVRGTGHPNGNALASCPHSLQVAMGMPAHARCVSCHDAPHATQTTIHACSRSCSVSELLELGKCTSLPNCMGLAARRPHRMCSTHSACQSSPSPVTGHCGLCAVHLSHRDILDQQGHAEQQQAQQELHRQGALTGMPHPSGSCTHAVLFA